MGLIPGSGRSPDLPLPEERMATHCSILAWRSPGTEEPDGLQFMGSQRQMEKAMATHSSVLAWENPRDRGAWWAAICGVAQIQT